jgi:hypothetical protein
MPRSRTSRKDCLIPPAVAINEVIRTLRGERVILDHDLARIYGVETRVLKQGVRRNWDKFPTDFVFELTRVEATNLQPTPDAFSRSQIVTLKRVRWDFIPRSLRNQSKTPERFTPRAGLLIEPPDCNA